MTYSRDVWEDVFRTSSWGKYPGEDLIRFVARNYYGANRQETRILEIGSGPGANIWYLAREGFAAYGIEGSPTAVARCEERLKSERLSAHLSVGDILNLPYEAGMFDAVIDIGCLCCNDTDSTKAILAEVGRVLRLGGKFYSRTLADGMYLGATYRTLAPLEYKDVSDGPLSGKGFVRLTNAEAIEEIYGSQFTVESREKSQYTYDNCSKVIIDWQLTCRK